MDSGAVLLDLQETDLAILRAEKRLDELPEKRAILESRKKQSEVRELRGKAEELVSRLSHAVSKNEDECAMLTEKIDHEQAKLMSGDVTNPKEVQHISREMDALKRRKDKLEMEQIELMERVEKAKGQVDKVDAALGQLSAKEAAVTDAFRAKGGELQTEIEALKAHRTEIAATLAADLLDRYERLRGSKNGVGVGRLDGAMCTACRVDLPAERLGELESGPDIAECPNCKRMLVVRVQETEE